jgi:hypothetical protein
MCTTKLKTVTATILALLLGGSGSGVIAIGGRADEQPTGQKPGRRQPLIFEQDVSRLPTDAGKRYAAIKPKPEEVKWRQIPWLVDLNKGIQVAKEEKRPLLIWTGQQSHPLERC